ncbi:MAG: hypothetical protein ABR588_05530 [Sphingomicrobium sp.]
MTRRLLLLSLILLAGCGKVAPLRPAPGQPLPVKPAMAATTPTAEDLLQLRADAAPQRVDELTRRSQPRRADRFDLPPPDGGAPALPVGATPPPTSTDKTETPSPK